MLYNFSNKKGEKKSLGANEDSASANIIIQAATSSADSEQFVDFNTIEPQPFDLDKVELPQTNDQCYKAPPLPEAPEVKYEKHEEPLETKTVNQDFEDVKTVVRDNVVHHTHYKPVETIVNRNHWHKLKIIDNDINYHHHLVDNVVKVNDIHHIQVEHVHGEDKTYHDYKQTECVRPPLCFCDDNRSTSGIDRQMNDLTMTHATIRKDRYQLPLCDDNNNHAPYRSNSNTNAGWKARTITTRKLSGADGRFDQSITIQQQHHNY